MFSNSSFVVQRAKEVNTVRWTETCYLAEHCKTSRSETLSFGGQPEQVAEVEGVPAWEGEPVWKDLDSLLLE